MGGSGVVDGTRQEEVEDYHPLTSRVRFRLSNRDFRARAHSNPLNDGNFDVPSKPSSVDWDAAFPSQSSAPPPGWVDIGCGYGGLLAEMSTAFPEKYMLGERFEPLQGNRKGPT